MATPEGEEEEEEDMLTLCYKSAVKPKPLVFNGFHLNGRRTPQLNQWVLEQSDKLQGHIKVTGVPCTVHPDSSANKQLHP